MSLRHTGLWHYEFIQARPVGHQWRVADADDDVVSDHATEALAREYVEEHNKTVKPHSDLWS